MKECPSCGYIFKKSGAEKTWIDFEFTKDNFSAFLGILMKTLAYLRANELSQLDMAEMQIALAGVKRGQPITFDIVSKFETVRMTMNISICAILEYFHLKKVAPKKCIRIKDVSVYTALEKIRHFSAHIIVDRDRERKAIVAYEKYVDKVFEEIAGELLIFILDGIDEYADTNKSIVSNLKNTDESRELLRLVNQKRKKDGRQTID